MNLNENYFHFLNGSTINDDIIDICLKRLELILKTGYILSRNKQLELLGDYQKGVSDVNWNGYDNISICIKTNHNKYNIVFKEYTDDVLNAYELFSVDNSMCIILRSDLLEQDDIKVVTPIYYLPGEFQIKNQISIEYFCGIGINFKDYSPLNIELLNKIHTILKQHKIDLPIININDNEKKYAYIIKRRKKHD